MHLCLQSSIRKETVCPVDPKIPTNIKHECFAPLPKEKLEPESQHYDRDSKWTVFRDCFGSNTLIIIRRIGVERFISLQNHNFYLAKTGGWAESFLPEKYYIGR